MARARGTAGYAAALIIFGFLFVVSLLLAIVFYTKIEAHKKAEQDAVAEIRTYISPAETAIAPDYAGEGLTAFGGLLARNTELKAENAALRTAKDKVTYDRDLKDKELTQKTDELATKTGELEAEKEEIRKLRAENKERVAELTAKNTALINDLTTTQTKLQAALDNADEASKEKIAELAAKLEATENQVATMEKQLAAAKVDLQVALDKLPKLPERNTTLPDGKIASTIAQSNDVFIDLGRRKGIVLGMKFEVFDPDPLIRLNDLGQARGKATIEVYKLNKDGDTATARIVRLERGESVSTGDPIVNLGYDPNKEIKLYAFGSFDIEGDGGTNDLDRIKGLITKSGATIPKLTLDDKGIPKLTPDVDYVILGAKPEFPEEPDATDDPDKIKAYQAQRAAYDAYYRIRDEAVKMRVPILNQNRFLSLVGYYER